MDTDEPDLEVKKRASNVARIMYNTDVLNYLDKKFGEKHEQYLLEIINQQENELAKEVKQLYCAMNEISKMSFINPAQSSGLLAGSILFPNKTCASLTSLGTNMLLQQCKEYRVTLNATLTNCGYQPTYGNKTVARDTWSLAEFSGCYWSDGLIAVNNKNYAYVDVERPANIHLHNLHLIEKFDEIIDNTPKFLLAPHPHENNGLEPLNILSEIVARVQSSNVKSLDSIIIKNNEESNWWDITTWFGIFKKILLLAIIIAVLGLIIFVSVKTGFASYAFSAMITCCCSPKQSPQLPPQTTVVTEPHPTYSAVPQHDHSKTIYAKNVHLSTYVVLFFKYILFFFLTLFFHKL